ncbi:MAG TPA: hypothetical protein VIX58_10130 [Anaerolineae bacterium]
MKAIPAWLRGHPRVSVTLVFAALTLLHLWSLMRVPPPFVDEAWDADILQRCFAVAAPRGRGGSA